MQVYSYRNTVQFTSAAQAVPKDALLVEVGPHSVLRSPLRQSRPDLGYVATMRKGECAIQSLATAVGDLWRKGVAVTWKADPVPTNPAGSEGEFLSPLEPCSLLYCEDAKRGLAEWSSPGWCCSEIRTAGHGN